MSLETTIKCPNCHVEIDVNSILYQKLEKELAEQTKLQKIEYQKSINSLKEKEELILEQKENIANEIKKESLKQIKLEKQKFELEIKKQIEDEQSEQMKSLQNELNDKSNQVKELNKTKAEIEKLKRDNSEIEDKIKAQAEKELNQKLTDEKIKFQQEQYKLKLEEVKKTEDVLAKKDKEILELQKNKKNIEQFKEEQNKLKLKAEEEFQKTLEEKLKLQKQGLEKDIKKQIENEQDELIKRLNDDLNEKSKKVIEFSKQKQEIEKLKRDKLEIEDKIKAESQKELNQTLIEEKLKIQKLAEDNNILKLKEKDEQLEQMQRKLDDAKRISEQGSMQIQGEAQELAIEEWLQSQFKYDNIEEIKKGAFGADCIQIVHERDIQNCGVICYESKNTKTWNNEWITKLKQDMLRVKGDIGVLVTKIMPNDMERMGFYNGIWVCSYEEFRGSSSLLRDGLIRVHKKMQTQENKTDKMSLLYNYLTSSEFNMQFNTIVDGFVNMQEELDKEKRSIQAAWRRRQKIIDGVISNTTEIYGSLQGIAGNSIGHIKSLEYDVDEDEIEDNAINTISSKQISTKSINDNETESIVEEDILDNEKVIEEELDKNEKYLEISTKIFINHFDQINEQEYKDRHTGFRYKIIKNDSTNTTLKQI